MPPREAVQRWRLVLARDAIDPGAVGREQLSAWESALVGSGLPVAGLDGAKPRPRFAVAAPLAASIPGEAELIDVWLVERLPVWRVRESLEASQPAGWRLVGVHDVWLGEAALPGRVTASVYRASIVPGAASEGALREAAAALLAATALPRERRKGETVVAYDLRPFIEDVTALEVDGAPAVRMVLRHDPERGVGRPEELLAALSDRTGRPLVASSLVREGLVLAEASRVAAGRPRPATRTGLRPR